MKALALAFGLLATYSAQAAVACYERIYTDAEILASPGQIVRSAKLKVTTDHLGTSIFLNVTHMDADASFTAGAFGQCHVNNRQYRECALLDDAGALRITYRPNNRALITVKRDLTLSGYDPETDEVGTLDLRVGRANGVLLLKQVPEWECNTMVEAPEAY